MLAMECMLAIIAAVSPISIIIAITIVAPDIAVTFAKGTVRSCTNAHRVVGVFANYVPSELFNYVARHR